MKEIAEFSFLTESLSYLCYLGALDYAGVKKRNKDNDQRFEKSTMLCPDVEQCINYHVLLGAADLQSPAGSLLETTINLNNNGLKQQGCC